MDSSLLTTAQRKASDDCEQKTRQYLTVENDLICAPTVGLHTWQQMNSMTLITKEHKQAADRYQTITHQHTHQINTLQNTHTHTHTQTPITDLVMSLCFYLCLFSSTNPYSSNSLVGWGLMALSTQSRSNLADWDCKHFWLAFCTVLSAARLLNDWSQRWIPSEFSAQNAKF